MISTVSMTVSGRDAVRITNWTDAVDGLKRWAVIWESPRGESAYFHMPNEQTAHDMHTVLSDAIAARRTQIREFESAA